MIPNSDSEEGKVFYYKMKGDYHRYNYIQISWRIINGYRYLAEFQNGDARKESAAKALEGDLLGITIQMTIFFLAYSAASSIANADLAPTHPIRLVCLPN